MIRKWGCAVEPKLPAFHAVPRLPSIANLGAQVWSMKTSAVATLLVGAMLTVAGGGMTWQAAALTLLTSFVSTTLWSLSAQTWIGASRNGGAPPTGMGICTGALTPPRSAAC